MIPDRILDKIDFTDDCWLWTGSRRGAGYPQLWADGRTHGAHRWIYETTVGAIPPGHELDHLCRTRHCVNPDHLEPVTHAENLRRKPEQRNQHTGQTHCMRGHEYDEANTYLWRGKRHCRTCRRMRERQEL